MIACRGTDRCPDASGADSGIDGNADTGTAATFKLNVRNRCTLLPPFKLGDKELPRQVEISAYIPLFERYENVTLSRPFVTYFRCSLEEKGACYQAATLELHGYQTGGVLPPAALSGMLTPPTVKSHAPLIVIADAIGSTSWTVDLARKKLRYDRRIGDQDATTVEVDCPP